LKITRRIKTTPICSWGASSWNRDCAEVLEPADSRLQWSMWWRYSSK